MLESKNTAMPDEKMTFEHGEVSLVNLTGLTVGRAELRPGWRWSTDIKPHSGTKAASSPTAPTSSPAGCTWPWTTAWSWNSGRATPTWSAPATTPGWPRRAGVIIDFIPDGAAALGAPAGPDDDAAVRAVIDGYGGALRSGDVVAIAELFTAGAAIMANGFPAAVGQAQITDIYTSALASVGMDYSYEFDQVEVTGDTAVARTRSTGTTTVRASGETSLPATGGAVRPAPGERGWRISAYIYQPQPEAA